MTSVRRALIDVHPHQAFTARPRLWAALEAAFPVRFQSRQGAIADGLVCFQSAGEPAESPASGCPALIFSDGAGGGPEPVHVLDEAGVDRRLRGLTLTERPSEIRAPGGTERVLAAADSGPVWTVVDSAAPIHRVHAPLGELAVDRVLASLLADSSIATVVLVQFLRSLTVSETSCSPPLRAALVFDDPNLRRESYGYISYRRLVEHADAHGYHAAVAMIPLDAGRPHAATAALFAQRRDRLSVVTHGNNHVADECWVQHDPAAALSLAAQARRRMERFERRSGLLVDRVMAPPHGMCSEQVARALGAVGFDALTGLHPLPWSEERPAAEPLAGWRISEFVGGCPNILRIPLNESEATFALAAFLDQPLILYGHHADLAGGFEPLERAAAAVNRLGEVSWMPVGEIARTNVAVKRIGDALAAEAYARRVRFPIPAHVGRLTVSAPADLLTEGRLTGWSLDGGPELRFGATVAVRPCSSASVRLHGPRDISPAHVPAPAWRPWPRLRRAATELRDRAQPLVRRAPRH